MWNHFPFVTCEAIILNGHLHFWQLNCVEERLPEIFRTKSKWAWERYKTFVTRAVCLWTCAIQCVQHIIFMTKLRFRSCLRATVIWTSLGDTLRQSLWLFQAGRWWLMLRASSSLFSGSKMELHHSQKWVCWSAQGTDEAMLWTNTACKLVSQRFQVPSESTRDLATGRFLVWNYIYPLSKLKGAISCCVLSS